MPLRPALFAIASSAAFLLLAQPVQAQASAKPACTDNCTDAGYTWAESNSVTDEALCASDKEDFAEGCKHYIEEKAEAAAPPLEEPAAVAEAAATEAKAAATQAEAAEEAAEKAKDAADDAKDAAEDAADKAEEAKEH